MKWIRKKILVCSQIFLSKSTLAISLSWREYLIWSLLQMPGLNDSYSERTRKKCIIHWLFLIWTNSRDNLESRPLKQNAYPLWWNKSKPAGPDPTKIERVQRRTSDQYRMKNRTWNNTLLSNPVNSLDHTRSLRGLMTRKLNHQKLYQTTSWVSFHEPKVLKWVNPASTNDHRLEG